MFVVYWSALTDDITVSVFCVWFPGDEQTACGLIWLIWCCWVDSDLRTLLCCGQFVFVLVNKEKHEHVCFLTCSRATAQGDQQQQAVALHRSLSLWLLELKSNRVWLNERNFLPETPTHGSTSSSSSLHPITRGPLASEFDLQVISFDILNILYSHGFEDSSLLTWNITMVTDAADLTWSAASVTMVKYPGKKLTGWVKFLVLVQPLGYKEIQVLIQDAASEKT